MATYSEVLLTFTNDWVASDSMVTQMDEHPYSQFWSWVATRSASYEVTAGTPTANAGETTAINFAAAFSLDFPTGYVVTVQNNNEVLIQSETEGEQFGLWQVFSGSGTMTSSVTNIDPQTKINVRSPYFVRTAGTNLTRAVCDLYIYTGTSTGTMVETTYSIDATAYNEEVSFEISQLIRDYLDITFNDTYDSQVVWVNYQITNYISDVAMTPNLVRTVKAFDGYGYFDEGVNPVLSERVLQSNSTMYVYDGNYFYIPIQQDYLSQVDLKSQGVIVDTETFTATSDSADVIRYIGFTNPSVCEGSTNYLFEDGNSYLFEDGNVFIFDGTDPEDMVDEIFITYSDASTESIYVKTISENKYTPYRLTFVNKFGALQSVWMFKRSDVKLTIESDNYRSYTYSDQTYSVSNHQYRQLYTRGREEISLNSGFYDEDYNEVFRQLTLSEKVWIHYEGTLLPVNLKSKDLAFKTRLNDKLINYKLDFEFAFDKINSVL